MLGELRRGNPTSKAHSARPSSRRSEEWDRLACAARLTGLGSFRYDVRANTFVFSDELYRIWGLEPGDDLAGMRAQMMHPDDRQRVVDGWNLAMQEGGIREVEYRIHRPDGEERHLRVWLEVLLDEDGQAVSVMGAHLDVTEVVIAEREALASQSLIDAVLTASPDYTFVTNLETGEIVYGSPGKSVLGFPLDEVRNVGSSQVRLVHPEDLPQVREAKRQEPELADGQTTSVAFRALHVDGTWHWVSRRTTPFRRDEQGRVVEILGVMRDITDEHETEAALRSSEAHLRALVSHVVGYAIIGLNAEGTITSWNNGAERLKGYTEAEAVGQNFAMFFTEADQAAGVPQAILAEAHTHGHARFRGDRLRRDGTTFWGDVAINAITADDGTVTGFAEVTRDLTEQRQLERARASLLATVTHDLRTPLTAIKLFAELIEDEDAEVRAEFAQRIATRVDHVTALVDNLFGYVKLSAGQVEIQVAPVALEEIVAECLINVSGIRGQRQIEVDPTHVQVVADRTAAERVLTNVLSNALKYSPDGSTVSISITQTTRHVEVRVTDRGRGIAPEDIEDIFEEFTRGRLAQPDGGTGLGLSSAKRLMELQGGTIKLISTLGAGTTVIVTFAAA